MKLCLLIYVALSLYPFCSSDVVNDGDIDPFDMINFDQSTMSMKNEKATENDKQTKDISNQDKTTDKPDDIKARKDTATEERPEQEKPKVSKCPIRLSPASPLFRQFVNTVLYHLKDESLGVGIDEYDARIKLTNEDIGTLKRYSESGTEIAIHDAHDVLTKMISRIHRVTFDGKSSRQLWLEEKIGMSLYNVLQVMILIVLLLCAVTLLVYLNFSWRQLVVYLLLFMFLGSVLLTWYSLYKKEVSKQHYTLNKDMPEHCKKREERDSGFMAVTFSWLSSSFTFQRDECLEYFEHILIDPLVKVSPMEAVAVTLTRFFIVPLKHIAAEVNEAFRALLHHLPLQLWPLILGFIMIFSFLLLFMGFGYRVALPFGMLAIEPCRQQTLNIPALEERIKDDQKKNMEMLLDQQQKIQEILGKCLEQKDIPAIKDGGGDNSAALKQITTVQNIGSEKLKKIPIKQKSISSSENKEEVGNIVDEGIETSSDTNSPPKARQLVGTNDDVTNDANEHIETIGENHTRRSSNIQNIKPKPADEIKFSGIPVRK